MLHLFGAGHSQLLALDVGWVERTPGHAATVLEGEDLRPGEVALVVSNSGVNAVPVEVAIGRRDRGLGVVALTNLAQAQATAARHPSGLRLHEVADVVIDNRCPAGDAAAALASGDRVGPLTTVVGVAALAARVAELLLEQGHNPPVLASQNLDGRRVAERNHQLLQPYRGRTRRPR